MATLRKMLGDMEADESIALMRLIETQSKQTLSAWALAYAKANFLPLYIAVCPQDSSFFDLLSLCETADHSQKTKTLIKQESKRITAVIREIQDPIAVAAARSVLTACGVYQTPTNAFGFLLYGAAAYAYAHAGLHESKDTYDGVATKALQDAYTSLSSIAIKDEPNPVNIKWYCGTKQ